MARPEQLKPPMLPSPLQSLCDDAALQEARPPRPDAHQPSLHTLAIQTQYNLQYQHAWSDLRIHTHSPLTNALLPRPLLSGLPPSRLYVHPDEQIELLKRADEEKASEAPHPADGNNTKTAQQLLDDPEREWVLPTRLSEKWTLHRLHDVFSAISVLPPEPEPATDTETTSGRHPPNPWRTTKRVLLATVTTDSTVAYYFIHEGAVKPRQN